MTYGVNQRILAQHYNNFVGISNSFGDPLTFYGTSPGLTENRLGAIWGLGHGRWGWGRSSPPITNVNPGQRISAANWNGMIEIIRNIAQRTGTTISYNDLASGDRIRALESLQSDIVLLNNNRFNSATRTLSSQVYSNTRNTNWNQTIVSRFNCVFNNGDEARYFFNSGGEILVRVRHNSNFTPQDQNWNNFLTNFVGDIFIGANGTRQVVPAITGNPGGSIATTRGYWTLDTVLANPGATVFNRTGASDISSPAYPQFYFPYSGNLVCTIKAIRPGLANINGNGDNGNTIQIEVTLSDNYMGPADNIQGGQTTVQIFSNRSTAIFTAQGVVSVTPIESF